MSVIVGTWNLEACPSRQSARGIAIATELHRHTVDVWFLTELHSDWAAPRHNVCLAPPRYGSGPTSRLAGIVSSWQMKPITALDDPVEGWMCLARLIDPMTGETVLAASTVLPWRGITPYWRKMLDRDMTYADAFHHVLDYAVKRIEDERLPGENVIWGGDFNQALSGRDYVGTHQGRQYIQHALDRLGLQAVTAHLPALIPTHPAIDHIAIPSNWPIGEGAVVFRPVRNGRPLTDHALYVVDARPTIDVL